MDKSLTTATQDNLLRKNQLINEGFHVHQQFVIPAWIEISPIDVCNRRCVFCPKTNELIAPDNPSGKMTLELVRKLCEELTSIQFRGVVMLAGYGEPLLHKGIAELVGVIARRFRVEITTNGDPLNLKLVRELRSSGLHKLIVSMYDGPQQIEKFKKLFTEAGVTEEFYVLRDRWYGPEENYGIKPTNRAGVIKFGPSKNPKLMSPCYYPAYSMMIDWNGDVLSCTQDWSRRVKWGNLACNDFWYIWTSKSYVKFRRAIVTGERTLLMCKECNADGTLHGLRHAQAISPAINL